MSRKARLTKASARETVSTGPRRVLKEGRVAFSDKRAESQTLRQATIQMGIEARIVGHGKTITLYNEMVDLYNLQVPI